jgi:hypothetical protein
VRSPAWPRLLAASTGPSPNTSVRVVPLEVTAAPIALSLW